MHEYSLVQALVERVGQEAAARQATAVRRLSVRIGELAGVDPDLFATAYETFRERTICDGAPLDLTIVPVQWGCAGCAKPVEAGQPLLCTICGTPATLVAGDEIVLDRIELEVP